jgi:hypothetical protein
MTNFPSASHTKIAAVAVYVGAAFSFLTAYLNSNARRVAPVTPQEALFLTSNTGKLIVPAVLMGGALFVVAAGAVLVRVRAGLTVGFVASCLMWPAVLAVVEQVLFSDAALNAKEPLGVYTGFSSAIFVVLLGVASVYSYRELAKLRHSEP